MILCVSTVHMLDIAVDMYFHWVSLRKLVYAVDKRHMCAYPTEFESAKNNGRHLVKVILFDHNSYYALQLMDRIFQEEVMDVTFLCSTVQCAWKASGIHPYTNKGEYIWNIQYLRLIG